MVENKINHIMLEHHDWEKVVDSVSWESVRPLIKEVIEKGIAEPDEFTEGVFHQKARIGKETVIVNYFEQNGTKLISDAFVER